ncbi:LLM class flavin-dependent oxidoreductase [Beijerinckia indica]|uniref:Luciferase-like monooxygenase n=1 Tax=Beijerinckia indica subsp. indica (strain ATCC 9039 / DSM 1715 / NCIMB 8712) TaxID=395963 RepID=B2IFI1_BEII9|nr:LLM class flavin-dependent oxidoreductase [Beijerinckia indica]ACB97106.1 Luciferase-like monooxygenase [Beijerinckia indica subsp. indica ATCC 9039]
MRTGLFCTYENPERDYASAYADQTTLVQLAEALGFDEAWVAEHHFNPDAASPSCLSILTYLAARTVQIRLGSAALLLPFRNPLHVAEDVATLDLLSGGRFNFGVAKGGPFPLQNKLFNVKREESHARTKEALALIQKLLTEDGVNFTGHYFNVEDVRLTPKPLQTPIPTFIATSSPEMIKLAAEQDYGIMAGPPFPLDIIQSSRHQYLDTAGTGDPRLVLIRFYHVAPTRTQALEEGARFLRPFVERMQISTASMQPEWTHWFKLDRLIEDSLIGTIEEVRDKVLQIEATLQPYSLILKPMDPSLAKRRADLEAFSRSIRPYIGLPSGGGLHLKQPTQGLLVH